MKNFFLIRANFDNIVNYSESAFSPSSLLGLPIKYQFVDFKKAEQKWENMR